MIKMKNKIIKMNKYKMREINKKNQVELMKFDKSVTSKAIQILADYVSKNVIRYLNVSVYNNLQKHAPVDLMVRHQIDTLGPLPGHLGFPMRDDLCKAAIPGRGASAFTFTFDLDTGIGWAAADELSLIAGGVEVARASTTNLTVQTNLSVGGDSRMFMRGGDSPLGVPTNYRIRGHSV